MNGIMDNGMKPKLLRLILKVYMPDEKHPCADMSILSDVITKVRTHKLLSEQPLTDVKKDFCDEWKSVVDSWINRLLSLASSPTPDNSWIGICLLGLTCHECSEERFLASYPLWLNHLQSHIQAPEVSCVVKGASCASISDLLTRLSRVSITKKDGISKLTGIIQPLLNFLNDDVPAYILEKALSLLCNLIIFFPSSVWQHHKSVKSTMILKIISGNCSDILIERLGHALAVLPKPKGVENSGSLLLKEILVCLDGQLNAAFEGFQEEDRSAKSLKSLLPSNNDPLELLGSLGCEQSAFSTRWPERHLVSRVSNLMVCCRNMLRNAMVPDLMFGFIALVERILMIDGTLSLSQCSLMTVLRRELIFSEIPRLQLHSLEMLNSLIEGLNVIQLLQCAPAVAKLLNRYLMRCKLPDQRIKAYSTLKSLLNSVGAGGVHHAIKDKIRNIFVDLDFTHMAGKYSDTLKTTAEELKFIPLSKKRKVSVAAEQLVHNVFKDKISHHSAPVPVKLAAVEALEAFLIRGGYMINQELPRDIGTMLVAEATNARKAGCTELHLASLRALLASFISSVRERSLYISISQTLREGMHPGGTSISEFCRQAFYVLRLPPYPNKRLLSVGWDEDQHISTSHPAGETENCRFDESVFDHDMLDVDFSSNDDEAVPQDNANHSEKPSAPWTGESQDEFQHVHTSSVTPQHPVLETVNDFAPNSTVDCGAPNVQPLDSTDPMDDTSRKQTGVETCGTEGLETTKTGSKIPPQDATESKDEAMDPAPDENDFETRRSALVESIAATLPDSDEESSDDQLPDIVDADPDSDD